MTQGLCDEIVLLDTDEGKARRHADDIADSVAYMPLPAKYTRRYEALADADIVVLSACSTILNRTAFWSWTRRSRSLRKSPRSLPPVVFRAS
ncbi:MAG: hypothetical protein ACLRRT_09545 [Ruthenibacterium lactatiformans]